MRKIHFQFYIDNVNSCYFTHNSRIISHHSRAGHYTVARLIRRINPSHSFPSVIVVIVSHGHGFQTV